VTTASGNTVRDLLEAQAGSDGDRVYLIAPETGRSLSFAALLDRSHALAALLAHRGIEPSSPIALLLPNGLQAVRLFVGAMAAGYVVTPLSLIAQPAQLAYVLEHSACRAVFVAPDLAERLHAALNETGSWAHGIQVIVVDPDSAEIDGEPQAAEFPALPADASTHALLMYTSGTTGRPKGVLLSNGNVTAGARFVSDAHELTAADRVLAVLPMYHINAQIVTALSPLHHGGSLVMPRRFSTSSFWSLAVTHGCTWLNVVPTIIAYLLEAPDPREAGLDISHFRFCRSASAPLPLEHHRAFEAKFGIGILETMGLTESAGPCFANPLAPAARMPGSPGRAYGNEAKVVDPESGIERADGVAGEILIRGANVMAGYFRAPQETERSFLPGGWLRTGDIGHRDGAGYFFITGRLKEIIIKGGENIAPREIDEVLLSHPTVLEAAAVGIPDARYGQEILAGVVLKAGLRCSEDEIRQFCEQRLGRFKTPRHFRFLAELPKGPSGKVQRLKLLDA
jgi:acyl-CoA synthetase (AMP-forming)/AMP-acid ligase II